MRKDRICITRQLVLPLLAYGDNIHRTANESLLHKIDSLYNRIACFVSKWGYYTHHCTMFEELGWPLQRVRREINWKTIVLKTFNPSNTPCLSKLLARSPQIQICMIHMARMLMLTRLHVGFIKSQVFCCKHRPKFMHVEAWQLLSTTKLHSLFYCFHPEVSFGILSTYHECTCPGLFHSQHFLTLNSQAIFMIIHSVSSFLLHTCGPSLFSHSVILQNKPISFYSTIKPQEVTEDRTSGNIIQSMYEDCMSCQRTQQGLSRWVGSTEGGTESYSDL